MSKKLTTEERIVRLTADQIKAKAKVQKAQAKELSIRMELAQLLAKNNELTYKVTFDTSAVTLKRNVNYVIPAAAYVDIKSKLDKEVFASTFTTSYKLKPAVFEQLSGDNKKIIEAHLTKKDAPLTVTVKEA